MKQIKKNSLFNSVNSEYELIDDKLLLELKSNNLYNELINSNTFIRLKNIHFLGAIDYLNTKKKKHTRYEHTLSVATLALKYSTLTNLKFDDERYLVCAALLHDIGHGPLSHSMEPSFKKLFNISHHIAGINIINGESPLGMEIKLILNKYNINIDKLIELLNGKSKEKYAFALDNPINIDTIDGVIRTSSYLLGSRNKNREIQSLTTSNVLEALVDTNKQEILNRFWNLKNMIYDKMINKEINIYADIYSQQYVLKEKSIKLNDFYLSEYEFKEKHQSLFQNLKILKKENLPINELSYTKRSYKINMAVKVNDVVDYLKKYTHIKIPNTFVKTVNVQQNFNLG
jgi:putative nucleotidyltransferase with HDIG domain